MEPELNSYKIIRYDSAKLKNVIDKIQQPYSLVLASESRCKSLSLGDQWCTKKE